MSDKDDKSLDVLGIKPFGEAINTVVKGTMEGIGAFLGKICLPAAEEFGLLLRDKVSYYRISNLAKVIDKTKKKIDLLGEDVSGEVNPKLLKEIVEESSWVQDDTLQEMWAGLLAGAATNPQQADDALIYTNTLKRLSAFQASLINLIYSDPRICSISQRWLNNLQYNFEPENVLFYRPKQILELSPMPLNKFVPIANVTSEEILNDERNHGRMCGGTEPATQQLIQPERE
jgi:hypothetical protein